MTRVSRRQEKRESRRFKMAPVSSTSPTFLCSLLRPHPTPAQGPSCPSAQSPHFLGLQGTARDGFPLGAAQGLPIKCRCAHLSSPHTRDPAGTHVALTLPTGSKGIRELLRRKISAEKLRGILKMKTGAKKRVLPCLHSSTAENRETVGLRDKLDPTPLAPHFPQLFSQDRR